MIFETTCQSLNLEGRKFEIDDRNRYKPTREVIGSTVQQGWGEKSPGDSSLPNTIQNIRQTNNRSNMRIKTLTFINDFVKNNFMPLAQGKINEIGYKCTEHKVIKFIKLY